ncbi:MAG: cupin domain-containing protein [Ekhidna sp.]
MRKVTILSIALAIQTIVLSAQTNQQSKPSIIKISKELLAGEGLSAIKQEDPERRFFQKRVYNGTDLAVYMVAIGSGITNEFESFPMEEFIFWKNGKALVEPINEEAFPIFAGDYFIQAKGFQGKWNFIGDGELHLELSVIARNRSASSGPSPISKALVIDRDLLSGVSNKKEIYTGVELTVNMLTAGKLEFEGTTKERMLHIVNGVITITQSGEEPIKCYPGEFIILREGFEGRWESQSLQPLRILEIYRS